MIKPPDELILSAQDDMLGAWALAGQVAESLQSTDDVVRLSVEGEYGSGKSSFLGSFLVQSGFAAPEVRQLFAGTFAAIQGGSSRAVYFNAAAWPTDTNLFHALLATLLDASWTLNKRTRAAKDLLRFAAAPLATALSWGNKVLTGTPAEDILEQGRKAVLPELERLARVAKSHRESATTVRNFIATLVPPKSSSGSAKLFLIVDNLDRALPHQSFGLLRSLESLVSFPSRTVVLYALDTAQLSGWLRATHHLDSGHLLLQKLFDLRLPLPAPREASLARVVGEHLVKHLPADVFKGIVTPDERSSLIRQRVTPGIVQMLHLAGLLNPRVVGGLLGKLCITISPIWRSSNATKKYKSPVEWAAGDSHVEYVGLVLYFMYLALSERFPELLDIVMKHAEDKHGSPADLTKYVFDYIKPRVAERLHRDLSRLLAFAEQHAYAFRALSLWLTDDYGFRPAFSRIDQESLDGLKKRYRLA